MSAKTKNVMIATIGIDTGKNTLHLIGFDLRGEVVLRQKMSRRAHIVAMWLCLALRKTAARTIVAVAMIAPGALIVTDSRAQSLDVLAHGDLRLSSRWAAPTRNFTLATEAYLTISNTGQSPDRLLGATAANARVVRIHKWIREDGLQKIRSLRDLTIDPGASVVMEPIVLNLKLMGSRFALREGQVLTLTLRFERAGDITLDLPVTLSPDVGTR